MSKDELAVIYAAVLKDLIEFQDQDIDKYSPPF